MVSFNLAREAYGRSAPTRSPRTIEYEVIAQTTHQLKTAAQLGSKGFPQLARALYDNRKLWTLLATSVAEKDNELPQSLRSQIFYLAEFTQVHSAKVLNRQAKVRPLIEVNMAVLRGLRQEGAPV
ncbi:flagellar biosynthesis regulator FlaF [Shimia thalassica]|uniref:flagellar biosynthesis regulator FlaF n=1 Tax=Shimia thalassica TaxID=1715693 RepID=UPI002732547D|nr:flagellar biosynthesis regulator FlaF [Shimia thalassica]MDP2495648.1 flagellar biosynthesis regulator FlaF [Shimia thalassica]